MLVAAVAACSAGAMAAKRTASGSRAAPEAATTRDQRSISPNATSASHAAPQRLAAAPPAPAITRPASATTQPTTRTMTRRCSPAGSHRPQDRCHAASSPPTASQALAKGPS